MRIRARGRRLGVGLIAAALAVAALGGCSQALRGEEDLLGRPYTGAFYDDPPAASGTPGAVVRQELAAGAPEGSTAWRILFRSTDLNGRPVLNSGMLVVPAGPAPAGGRTIVSWAKQRSA